MTKVGSIVFGPTNLKPDVRSASGYGVNGQLDASSPFPFGCNCIGPQPGESKCPCKLRSESEQGKRMIEEGVTIDGKKYKLVLA